MNSAAFRAQGRRTGTDDCPRPLLRLRIAIAAGAIMRIGHSLLAGEVAGFNVNMSAGRSTNGTQ